MSDAIDNQADHAETKQRKPRAQRPAKVPAGHDLFANEIINEFRLTGGIVAADVRAKGATVITIQAGSVRDAPITPGLRYRTSRFMVRIPVDLKETFPDELLIGPGSIVTVVGRLQGIIDVYQGREFISYELVARKIQFIARFGTVTMSPNRLLMPVIEHQGEGHRDTQSRIRKNFLGLIAELDSPAKEQTVESEALESEAVET
ncbi:hypothetical protein [Sinimarinibacterium sp. NLF-5-8]|uniref:hypothetical protein n=1 Tax=Sinimarinibacterium sp. NLF-5-8 TaxID=2698684 RepID=UPI00137C0480|nr:hypothetical protein [Sinimarinibacterium sp. NLF-5-8]QHS08999.1 hypothetical protein GT972_01810 [Sinimarinibacterium sp. NLF-5-8]